MLVIIIKNLTYFIKIIQLASCVSLAYNMQNVTIILK